VYLSDWASHVSNTAHDTLKNTTTVDGTEVELNGWSLQKFAKEICDSDPNAYEFAMSEQIVYPSRPSDGIEGLCSHIVYQHCPASLIAHYESMAKSNYHKYIENGNDKTAKRMLLICRSLLMVQYIAESKSMAPLHVPLLISESRQTSIDAPLEQIEHLVDEKRSGSGDEWLPVCEDLLSWADDSVSDGLDIDYSEYGEPTPDKNIVESYVRDIVRYHEDKQ
jgi:predicted nucleotidyltransferase